MTDDDSPFYWSHNAIHGKWKPTEQQVDKRNKLIEWKWWKVVLFPVIVVYTILYIISGAGNKYHRHGHSHHHRHTHIHKH